MYMSGNVPDKSKSIIQDPNRIFCQEHWEEIVGKNPGPEEGAKGLEATLIAIQHALGNKTFYKIAYRIKNGYPPPNDTDEIPEGEQPETIHINKALDECSPLCCYLDNEIFQKIKQLELPEELSEE